MSMIPYDGSEPYIFISYSHKDSDRVFPIIENLQKNSYRVWYDEGIDPGQEWAKKIAHRVKHCGYFIALMSQNYLDSANCKDELAWARETERKTLMLYLEDVRLPDDLAMRFNRWQYICKYSYIHEDDFYIKLFSADGINITQDIIVIQETSSTTKVTSLKIESDDTNNMEKDITDKDHLYDTVSQNIKTLKSELIFPFLYLFSICSFLLLFIFSDTTINTTFDWVFYTVVMPIVYIPIFTFSVLEIVRLLFFINQQSCYRSIVSSDIYNIKAISISAKVSQRRAKTFVNSLILEETWIAAYIDHSTNELILLHTHDFHLKKRYQYKNFRSTFRIWYWSSLIIPTALFVILRVILQVASAISVPIDYITISLLGILILFEIIICYVSPLVDFIIRKRERTLYVIIEAERTTNLNDIAKKSGLSVTKVTNIVDEMIYAGILEHMYINHRTQEIVRINPNQE